VTVNLEAEHLPAMVDGINAHEQTCDSLLAHNKITRVATVYETRMHKKLVLLCAISACNLQDVSLQHKQGALSLWL
jgi:hypothetical protein